MKELILLKYGEIVLKGLNRNTFEQLLVKNARRAVSHLGAVDIKRSQSTMRITPLDPGADIDEYVDALRKVFGFVSLSRAAVCEKSLEAVSRTAVDYLAPELEGAKTFKVESKRSDKTFPMTSLELSAEVGGRILDRYPHLSVDVHDPEVTVRVEIRDFGAYVHGSPIQGAGGLPVGTGGKAAVLISGGIDSPVAAWMMAKRGAELTAVHFASPPYTSELAEQKVKDLLRAVSEWSGRIRLFIVPFTKIQECLRENCPEELFTVLMRRYMVRVAQRIARREECLALISGESLGQVASQTLSAMVCTDAVADMPVLRPLVGMDKSEIVIYSRRIGTFDLSILPYEDCCTVFTPRHPRTRPTVAMLSEAEAKLNAEHMEALVSEAVTDARPADIVPYEE